MKSNCSAATGVMTALLLLAAGSLPGHAQPVPDEPETGSESGDESRPGFWQRFLYNRYLGVALRLSSLPYAGNEREVTPFPVISRLTDYHYTGQRFFSREGVAGLRFTGSEPWETGVVISGESLGFEEDDSPLLAGMAEREGSLDGGVFAAYRQPDWYLELVAVTDLLDRHEGDELTLTLGLPWRSADDLTVIVPHLDLIYRDDDRVDYYFGVRADEALPGRPAYVGGASTSPRVAIRGWHRFAESRWAIKGAVNVERLGDEITASPIVDEDFIFSINVGFAYRFGGDRKADSE